MKKFVVTITREFGSMGRPIAKRLSELLHVEYYDRDIVEAASQKLDLPVSVISNEEEKDTSGFFEMLFPLGTESADRQTRIFQAQSGIITALAAKESCIIVGRCSDFILSDVKNSLHIYIYASYEARLQHCIKDLGLEEAEARRMIKSVDEARNSYHMQYAGYHPDDKNHKSILVDSSFLGVEGTADFLVDAVKRKFQL